MKRLSNNRIVGVLIATIMLACVAGCSSPIEEMAPATNEPPRMVGVTTRSTTGIGYPLTLYAFYSGTGALASSVTASSSDDALTMPLRVGSYQLVALAGAGDAATGGLETVTSPTASQGIGVPNSGLITSAVQMGRADITVVDRDISAELTLSYQVVQVDIELHDIPTDVTEVSVSLSSLYTDVTFNGTLGTPQPVTIPLSKGDDGVWRSATVYTLPGSTTQLTLSISMTNATETKTYGYTHSSNLVVGTPYTLLGSYIEGFYFTPGSIAVEGWKEPQRIEFTFGLGAAAGGNNGGNSGEEGDEENAESGDDNNEGSSSTTVGDDLPDDTDGSYWVYAIPSAISIWNGHFVGVVTNNTDTKSAEVLLMSLQEWETTAANAPTVWSGYKEGNITDWRIPTANEMLELAKLGKTSNMDKTNFAIVNDGGGTKVTNSVNYLCEGGTKIVTMGGSSTSAMLAGSDTYRLRLVKSITVKMP